MNQYIQIIREQNTTEDQPSFGATVRSGRNWDAIYTTEFQIDKAEKDNSISGYRQSMDEASKTERGGGWFSSSEFYKNAMFWVGPETDSEANTLAAWAIALQAREMQANQRPELIKLAKEFHDAGRTNWQMKRSTNRQKILNSAANKLEIILEPYAKQIGVNKRGELKSAPLTVLRESAKKENLEFKVPSYPELLSEAVAESAKDAAYAARRGAKIVDRMASTLFGEPCRPDETEAECAKRQTRDTYIRYGLFGIFGLTALGAVGIYYVNTIKGAVKSVTGGKKSSSKPKKQQIIEQQIIEQQVTAQEQ